MVTPSFTLKKYVRNVIGELSTSTEPINCAECLLTIPCAFGVDDLVLVEQHALQLGESLGRTELLLEHENRENALTKS